MASAVIGIYGPTVAKYVIPSVIGGVLGGIVFYFVSDSICTILKKHWFLSPLLGAFAAAGGMVLLILSTDIFN